MRKKIYLISGFTLIELLVAMGIVALLGTSSVAIIGNFNRRQAINIAYDDVKNALAQTKSYALSQVVSASCDVKNPDKNSREQLIGYELRFDTVTNPAKHSYSIYEICEPPGGGVKAISPVNTYYLPKDVSFSTSPSSPAPVRFKVLNGGATSASSITIVSGTQTKPPITVTVDGAIK